MGFTSTGSAWVFQANPKLWDVDRFLAAGHRQVSWLVQQYKADIGAGDRVFLWRSGDRAGVIATARVTAQPSLMPEDKPEFRTDAEPAKFRGERLRVRLQIDNVLRRPLTRTRIRLEDELSEMAILKRPQGTNFPLKPSEEAAITKLIGQMSDNDG
jgi:predicted RNA-binding protein with PUA-like domain